MNTPQQKPTVALEDLLRLKRAERPPEKFWGEFDRQLRAKQLAAIVEPRPWWAPLIRVGARFSHFQFPVGAAAILTLTLLTVREYRSNDSAPVYEPDIAVRAVMPAAAAKVEQVAIARPAPSETAVTVASLPEQSQNIPAATAPAIESDPMPRQASPNYAVFSGSLASERAPTPSARYMAANLAAVQNAEPGLGDVFVQPSRVVISRQPMREPLAQVAPPSESRLARLLSPALPVTAVATEASLRGSDRVDRSLTEDRLYDTMSRFSARGAGVAMKF